jgi:outer membrane protein assembly factor BamB
MAVVAGFREPNLAFDLARTGRFAVVALAPDAATRDGWRAKAVEARLAPYLLIEDATELPALPCWNDQIDLVVIDADALADRAPSEAELHRVLASRGVARIRRDGTWESVVEPDDPRLGNWGHDLCNPDRNPVSSDSRATVPTGLRWISGMRGRVGCGFLRIDGPILASMAVSSQKGFGHAAHLADNPAAVSNSRGRTGPFVARLAHSGVPLWNSLAGDLRHTGTSGSKDQNLIASDGELFTTNVAGGEGRLTAISLATGDVLRTYDALPAMTDGWESRVSIGYGRILIADENELILADRRTGNVLWRKAAADKETYWFQPAMTATAIAAFQGKVGNDDRGRPTFRGATRYRSYPCDAVVALDPASGDERWRWHNPGHPTEPNFREACQLFIADDGVFVFRTSGQSGNVSDMYWLACIELADGRLRWRIEPEGMTPSERNPGRFRQPHGAVYKMAVIGDRVYLIGSHHQVRSVKTGKILLAKTPTNTQCPGPGFSCNLLARGNGFFYDLGDPEMRAYHNWVTRGPCAALTYIARGLTFFEPSNCSCSRYLYGEMALHGDAAPPQAAPETRHEALAPLPAPRPAHPGDWPTFLGNARRSCQVETRLPAKLAVRWTQQVTTVPEPDNPLLLEHMTTGHWNGPLTAPVVADGGVFIGDPIRGTLIRLDSVTGERRWRQTIGVRLDAPPTWHAGAVYFGADDGRVTCLDAASGRPVWRYLVARSRRAIVAHGRPASSWPVQGGVLVGDGHIFASAGWHQETDGGVQLACLDAGTGAALWMRELGKPPEERWQPFGTGRFDESTTPVQAGTPFIPGPGLVGVPGAIVRQSDGEPVEFFYRKAKGYSHGNVRVDPSDETPVAWMIDFTNRIPTVNHFANHARGTGDGMPVAMFRHGERQWTDHTGLLAASDSHAVGVQADGRALSVRACAWGRNEDLQHRPAWTTEFRDVFPLALLIAGDQVVVAGITMQPDPERRYRPLPGTLLRFRLTDGTLIDKIELPSSPIQHGLAAARGCVYVAGQDGSFTCLGSVDSKSALKDRK